MVRRSFAILLSLSLGALSLVLITGPARAQLSVDIVEGHADPLPIAITDFYGELPDDARTGADMSAVITANLAGSGLFRPVNKGAFIQTPDSLRAGPRFGDWRLINAQALLTGAVQLQGDGRLRVEFRLWDVFAESQMTGLAYFTTPGNWRQTWVCWMRPPPPCFAS